MNGTSTLKYVLSENRITVAAMVVLGVFLTIALIGPLIAPHDPLLTNVDRALLPPSSQNWFGTDMLGRDIFSRVIVATRLDLTIAFAAVMLAWTMGCAIGAVVGFYGGFLDAAVNRAVDVLMAFPLFVLAITFVFVFGNTVLNVIVATAVINLPFYVRLARAEVSQRSSAGYVLAARMAGAQNGEIIFLFLLPNILPVLAVQMSLNLGWAILNAAGLSFVGLGVRPPTPEWGLMVAEGATFIVTAQWWVALFPALTLVACVFSFNLLGDGLRDALDPKRRS